MRYHAKAENVKFTEIVEGKEDIYDEYA